MIVSSLLPGWGCIGVFRRDLPRRVHQGRQAQPFRLRIENALNSAGLATTLAVAFVTAPAAADLAAGLAADLAASVAADLQLLELRREPDFLLQLLVQLSGRLRCRLLGGRDCIQVSGDVRLRQLHQAQRSDRIA